MKCVTNFLRTRRGFAALWSFAFSLVAFGLAHPAGAGAPPRAPILAVEVGMHTAMIRRIAVNEARGIVVSASDDKTVRVWSLSGLRLLRTLRPPIGSGQEGRLFALALAPDGRTIAVGGWTGWEWDGSASIYLFDAETGVLRGRLQGLPNVIGYLSFSRDGRFLAAGLGGTGGLRIYRTADYSLALEDRDYAQAVLGIDFDGSGRAVVSSLDRRVRLYDARFKRAVARVLPESTTPVMVVFSPDGTKVAVGTYSAQVALLSGKDLSPLPAPNGQGLDDQFDLPGVAWSNDGRYLHAIGDHKRGGRSPVFRWDLQTRKPPTKLLTAANLRLTGLAALSDGRALYAAEDPALGILGRDGYVFQARGPEIADFRDIDQALRISGDATTVEFSFRKGEGHIAHMALLDRKEMIVGPARDVVMYSPQTSAPGVSIIGWKDQKTPSANGVPLGLDREEYARSLAIAPDGQRFVLGAEWSLRAFGRNGQPLWTTPLAQIAWGVVISGDGRTVVAALSDGTLRWYRMEDGREYLALFPRPQGDWIAWVPQGYYASSEYGDNFIGWQLNRDKATAADFFLAVQFERILYRYDIVSSQLADRGNTEQSAGGRFDIAQLATIAPPRLRLEEVSVVRDALNPRLRVTFAATSESLPMRNYTVFVNNIPITPSASGTLARDEAIAFSRSVIADVFDEDVRIRVEVANDSSAAFAERRLEVPEAKYASRPRGKLFLVAIGVNAFAALPAAWRLRYAAEDADAIGQVFRTQRNMQFEEVFIQVLSDNQSVKPTRDAIAAALELVRRAGPHDTVVIFLASHGLLSPSGGYYFVPADARLEDVERVARGQSPEAEGGLVGWETFFEAMRSAAGRRVMIVDTCAGRGIAGGLDQLWLKKRSASASFALMVSSRLDEKSQEYDVGRHGLFTYALLRGVQTGCDGACPKTVSLQELFDYAVPWVKENRPEKRLSQTPQLNAPEELRGLVLAHH